MPAIGDQIIPHPDYGRDPLPIVNGVVTVPAESDEAVAITLTQNVSVVLRNPPVGYRRLEVIFLQDATGSRTVTWTTPITWTITSAPIIDSNPNGRTRISLIWDNGTWMEDAAASTTFRQSGVTGSLLIGPDAGKNMNLSTTYGNTAVGNGAQRDNVSSSGNTSLGLEAMSKWTTWGDSTGVGTYALSQHLGGVGETAIGFRARGYATGGGNNTAVGDSCLRYCNGHSNVGMGFIVGQSMTSGDENVLIGRAVCRDALAVNDVVVIGAGSLEFASSDPVGTVAVGFRCAPTPGVCIENTLMGFESGFQLSGSAYNSFYGTQSGRAITSGSGNVFVGRNAGATIGTQLATANNTIGIGENVSTTKDNQVVLGNTSIVETMVRGLVCLGGNTVAFPALKRSGTTIQARTATDSTFARFQGELQTHANAVAGGGLVPTHSVVLYDAAGTAYRVPCLV